MDTMRAKPTQYGAIRTRSRLEAQWCVYFDATGWSWQYEPTCPIPGYLPDFLVQVHDDLSYWVEIKPESWFDRAERDRVTDEARWQVLADTTDIIVLVHFGPPGTWKGGELDLRMVTLSFVPRGHRAIGPFEAALGSTNAAYAVRDHDYESGEPWRP